jgi:hypothetical protein
MHFRKKGESVKNYPFWMQPYWEKETTTHKETILLFPPGMAWIRQYKRGQSWDPAKIGNSIWRGFTDKNIKPQQLNTIKCSCILRLKRSGMFMYEYVVTFVDNKTYMTELRWLILYYTVICTIRWEDYVRVCGSLRCLWNFCPPWNVESFVPDMHSTSTV